MSSVCNNCVICGTTFVGFGNNAMPVKRGLCCDRCNNGVIVVRMNPSAFPTLIASAERPSPRRSQRRRKPSLKAREVNNDGIEMLEKGDKNSDYAWDVGMFLLHNFEY